ncbi:hypothetical protein Taro_004323 [Colocasia esculenta]|uniref:Uncharacterized protein n=1 Tax=Colocasia esculenta TaxID=4460 RepID=A0A843THU7_COLES|nr:hypothetical protein [Colocasia esculenta]
MSWRREQKAALSSVAITCVLVVVLPVEVCHGVGTVVVVVGHVLNVTVVGVTFWFPLFSVDLCMCAVCRTLGWPANVRTGKATP